MLNTSSTTLAGDPALSNDIKVCSVIKSSDIFNGEPFDGLYFKKDDKPEELKWSFSFMRFNGTAKFQHNQELELDNWLIVLFEPDEEELTNVVYFQAYLGDPLRFAHNQVKAGSQGIMIKKSVAGFSIIMKTLHDMDLETIKGQLKLDLIKFEKL